jgi:hypothetical protein
MDNRIKIYQNLQRNKSKYKKSSRRHKVSKKKSSYTSINDKKHFEKENYDKISKPLKNKSCSETRNYKRKSSKRKKEIIENKTSIKIISESLLNTGQLRRQNQFIDFDSESYPKKNERNVDNDDNDEIFTFKEDSNKELSELYNTLHSLSNEMIDDKSLNTKLNFSIENKNLKYSKSKALIDSSCYYCKIF